MTIPKQPVFDVCVIGSGPAGGVLSKELAEAGAKVVLVEAGRKMTARDFRYHTWPYEMPLRGVNESGSQPAAAFPPELLDAVRYENSDKVGIGRVRAVGGRSIHWTGVCLRFAEDDFRERSTQGIEDDWPITYKDVAPYYSYVERMIGVTGSRENLPIVPDGEYLPPLKFRCSEKILKAACRKMGIPMIPARKALLTVPHDNRPACHYCGHCDSGCDVGAIFSVPVSMLPKAERTGNFTLMENKLARELLVDNEGQVRAVSVIDTVTRREEEVRARVFAVSCGNAETARLLLNSRSPRFPNGIANSNDVVGRYLTGHITYGARAYLEELVGTPPVNNDGAEDHSYIPRFKLGVRKPDYAGGFQIQVQHTWFMLPYHAQFVKGFGEQFKQQVRSLQPGYCFLGCFGKVLAKYENRLTVDASQTDNFGIPIPVVHFRFSDNDMTLWRDMIRTSGEILDTAKVRMSLPGEHHPGGFASHDVGTVRMGKDPKTSVLNSFCQTHEVENLFVVDGSCFTTAPEKNPTLTIMALAVRTAHYMVDAIRKEISEGKMSTRNDSPGGMDRRQALYVLAGTVAGTVSLPSLSEGGTGGQPAPDGRQPESATGPKFLNRDELQVIDVLSEIIIPADDHSPGARAAQVAGFIDELISQSSETTKQRWRQGLKEIELTAKSRHGRTFLACSLAEQVEIMHVISENEGSPRNSQEEFFADLKRATVDGYYRSAIGIHNDLQYQGNKYRLAFSGCDR